VVLLLAELRQRRGDTERGRALATTLVPLLARQSDAALLARRAGALRRAEGATPLTTAERRVLELLPTHLSMREISERLFLSRNTVKSQAISIYRKLGVSARSPAVERARSLGLLSR
jgi:LuxR family maltose regulon positive regulatory protein